MGLAVKGKTKTQRKEHYLMVELMCLGSQPRYLIERRSLYWIREHVQQDLNYYYKKWILTLNILLGFKKNLDFLMQKRVILTGSIGSKWSQLVVNLKSTIFLLNSFWENILQIFKQSHVIVNLSQLIQINQPPSSCPIFYPAMIKAHKGNIKNIPESSDHMNFNTSQSKPC